MGMLKSRAHWVTYAFGTTFTSVVGTKGAGTLTKGAATSAKAGAATVKAGAKQAVEHARNLDIAKLLPYNQQYQLAGVNVPFNVVDGRNLLDQQLKKADRVIGDPGNVINRIRYGEQYTKVNNKKTLKPNIKYNIVEML
ncbi:hypothetical protein P5G51_013710 [Virgibacillus sp. 179-BFC.A HS]|uniref:Pre-toxin TG domain-containing protein n=1 Tax=Tigheibacillus jepli TaxID=3035914 RepID=A0ABU5CIX6_9BACI|nr:hypothetical protein [Virgibacillus sp. 179-BFC.A HS]MDY0406307.1 hypothetical protein [Virgibacillus sp. 179-BFC.A HS]